MCACHAAFSSTVVTTSLSRHRPRSVSTARPDSDAFRSRHGPHHRGASISRAPDLNRHEYVDFTIELFATLERRHPLRFQDLLELHPHFENTRTAGDALREFAADGTRMIRVQASRRSRCPPTLQSQPTSSNSTIARARRNTRSKPISRVLDAGVQNLEIISQSTCCTPACTACEASVWCDASR